MRHTRHPNRRIALALLAASALAQARAGTLEVAVAGPSAPAADAVVSLHSTQAAAASRPGSTTIDQRDAQFVPRVTAVQVGTQVRFPNSDDTRHQVYSFSEPKRFSLPLYHGAQAPPVRFDRVGVVELGCNIHDWMVASVVVLDTPYYAISDARGHASIVAPPGRYRLRVWHPHLGQGAAPESEVTIGAGRITRKVALPLSPPMAQGVPADDKLRALQDKFRKLKRAK